MSCLEHGDHCVTLTFEQLLERNNAAVQLAHRRLERINQVEFVLRGLYGDQVDYLKRNNLDGMDNHWMKMAREVLGIERDATP